MELSQACTQGITRDGEILRYPRSKTTQPIPPECMAFMGSYYNDHGVNLQYDFCAVERQPETAAWMRYYLQQRPDAAIIWHCNAGTMIGPQEEFLPVGYQHAVSRLAGAVRRRLQEEGCRTHRLSWADLPGMGKGCLNQVSATYHVCGALPVLCELPSGGEPNPLTCDELLDIGLLTIEEILHYAHTDGLRPYEFWEKVRRSLEKEDQ